MIMLRTRRLAVPMTLPMCFHTVFWLWRNEIKFAWSKMYHQIRLHTENLRMRMRRRMSLPIQLSQQMNKSGKRNFSTSYLILYRNDFERVKMK